MPPRKPIVNVQRASQPPQIIDSTVLNQSHHATEGAIITSITSLLNNKVQELFGLDNQDLLA